jgi:hypothetical protein
MERHRRGRYIGRASRRVGPDEPLTVQAALDDAYDRAINAQDESDRTTPRGPVTFRFKVVAIEIEGTNPIGDYIVHLADA